MEEKKGERGARRKQRRRGCQRCAFRYRSSVDRRGKKKFAKGTPQHVYENVNYKRKRCAPACRQQCTPLLLFERITMDHVGETGLMVSGWDVPRTEPVVRSRTFYAPLFQLPLPLPFSTRYSAVFLPTTATEQPMNNFEYRSPPFASTFHPTTGSDSLLGSATFCFDASRRIATTDRNPPHHRYADCCSTGSVYRVCENNIDVRSSTFVFGYYLAIAKHLQRIATTKLNVYMRMERVSDLKNLSCKIKSIEYRSSILSIQCNLLLFPSRSKSELESL